MNRIILVTSLKVLCPLIAIYSVYMLLRGHNEPGGGFIGGLMLSLSAILWILSSAKNNMLRKISTLFPFLLGACLVVIFSMVLLPVVFNQPILTGLWTQIGLPVAGKLSSVLIFDIVVYLIVFFSSVFSFLCFFPKLDGSN